MARISSLFSSSKGNSTLIGCSGRYVMIDAGVSAKKLCTALSQRDVSPESIAAIFITHEHIDHVSGVRVFAGKYKIPVYATEGTLRAMEKNGHLCGVEHYVMNGTLEMPEMKVCSFATSHDAAESCGYTVETVDGRKAAVATDMGYVSDTVRRAISGCDTVLIESNHDERMLRYGPYPPLTKQRILSDRGHLSNPACASELAELIRRGSTRFYLGHISGENNTALLAYETSFNALTGAGMKKNYDYMLSALSPDGGEMVVF